jgi:ribA/ribD-fused uncharacterized protein
MHPDVIPTFTDDFYWLSNFFVAPVEIEMFGNRMRFHSSEAAYQAGKTWVSKETEVDTKAYLMLLANEKDPGKSKKIARAMRIDAKQWDKIKDEHMRKVVFAKFLQNPDLCANLLDTGTAMLVEGNTWGDKYWGRVDGKGLNRLGAILMEVRGYWVFNAKTDNLPITEQQAHIMMGW